MTLAGFIESMKAMVMKDSHSGLRGKISTALQAIHSGTGEYPWISDTFGDNTKGTVVYSMGNQHYARSYKVDGDTCTLGDAKEVEPAYVPKGQAKAKEVALMALTTGQEPLEEAALTEMVPLREGALDANGRGLMKLIVPGDGSSGFYSAAVLERAARNGVWPEGTHIHLDHMTEDEKRNRPEGSVRTLAGKTTAIATFQENGVDGPGVYAPVEFYPDVREFVEPRAKDIGASIDAQGTRHIGESNGKRGYIIDDIATCASVDLVTKAGAGGKLISLYESYRRSQSNKSTHAATSRNHDEGEGMAIDEKEFNALKEAKGAADVQIASLRESVVKGEARAILAERLADSKLPPKGKERVRKSLLESLKIDGFKEADFRTQVDTAIKDEEDYLKENAPAPGVRGMGEGTPTPQEPVSIEEARKQTDANLARLMGKKGAA